MRVNIDEIKDAGLDRSWDLTREQLDKALSGDPAGYRARGPAHVRVHLEKVERRVRVEASASAEVQVACGRCLAPTPLDVPVEFDLTLVPAEELDEIEGGPSRPEKDASKGRQGGSFEPREAEEETYAGKVVDLDPFVREQILLALPGYPVCGEGCKGLCPVCGKNLNEGDCGCDRRVADPRWAALRNLKL